MPLSQYEGGEALVSKGENRYNEHDANLVQQKEPGKPNHLATAKQV